MEKAFAAQKLANKLFATETAVDAAMTEAMSLLAGMMETRKEFGLSATVGDVAAAKVADAISTLAAAKSAIVVAHGEMADLKLRVGLRTKMIGVMDKPPNQPQTQYHDERNVA